MDEIWRTQDRLGREVIFTSEERDHILEHDDMANRIEAIRPAIEHPGYVTGC